MVPATGPEKYQKQSRLVNSRLLTLSVRLFGQFNNRKNVKILNCYYKVSTPLCSVKMSQDCITILNRVNKGCKYDSVLNIFLSLLRDLATVNICFQATDCLQDISCPAERIRIYVRREE